MFEPSLVLLFLKTVLIFFLSALAGWSVIYKLFVKTTWMNWVIFTVTGASLLNLVCIWALLLGFPMWTGLAFVGLLLLVKFIVSFRVDFKLFCLTKQKAKQVLAPILLLCSLNSISYFLPFVIEGTSGYYSRGGVDHVGYLVYGEWFVKNSIWETPAPYELIPPQRQWKAKEYSKSTLFANCKNFSCINPVANQLVATPFMQILPGSNEETYTAAVAFYTSMACWSSLALLFILLKKKTIRWWTFAPLFLSNVIIFAATTQSIPFLLAISMINVSLLLYWLCTKKPLWQTDIKKYGYFLPIGLMHATLLAVYPHGFLILMAFMCVMAISCWNWERLKRYFILSLTATFFGVASINFFLFTSIPLTLFAFGLAPDFGSPFHLLHIIASYSGISDFLFWYPNNALLQKKVLMGLIPFMIILWYAGKSFISSLPTEKPFLISLFVIPATAITYYHFRGNGSYQIARFTEIGHLYLLALAGFAFSSIAEKSPKQVLKSIVFVLILIIPELVLRTMAVKEVLSIDHYFGTEFRNTEALEGVKKIATIQNQTEGADANRIAYYFGPGDGVDHAGGSVLLRNLHYLHARGNTMASYFDSRLPGTNTRVWKKEWLDQAILVIRPESNIDIIEDLRSGAFSKPLLDTARLKIYDSKEQPLVQLLGDSWHEIMLFSPRDAAGARPCRPLKGVGAIRDAASARPCRYLKGVGTIVLWSKERKRTSLFLFFNSDAPGSRVQLESNLFSEGIKMFNIPKFEEVVPDSPVIQLELDLDPGANVIKLTPQRDGGPPPWLIFWKVKVK